MSLGPAAALVKTPKEAAPAAAPETLTRTVLVTIQGSPASFDALGAETGSWSLTPDQAVRIFTDDKNKSFEHALNEIRNVILKRVSILDYKTNVPDVCGLTIEGLPANEYTQTGDSHHLYLLGAGTSTNPIDVFCASGDTDLGLQWMREFPNFSRENIRTCQVMRLDGADYYFVHETHPVIALLYHNQDKLGTVIEKRDLVNNHWYSIDLHVFEDSCNTLETDVLSKAPPVFDLSKLTLRLRRPDNKRWMDTPMLSDGFLDATMDVESKREQYKKYSESSVYLVARVQLEYSVPRQEVPVD